MPDIMMGNRGVLVTVEGNVIDLDCFIEHGGFGPEHARCSRFCAEKGLPAAILDFQGNVYQIQGRRHQALADVNNALLDFTESTVIVHGELLRRLDLRVLMIEKTRARAAAAIVVKHSRPLREKMIGRQAAVANRRAG